MVPPKRSVHGWTAIEDDIRAAVVAACAAILTLRSHARNPSFDGDSISNRQIFDIRACLYYDTTALVTKPEIAGNDRFAYVAMLPEVDLDK